MQIQKELASISALTKLQASSYATDAPWSALGVKLLEDFKFRG